MDVPQEMQRKGRMAVIQDDRKYFILLGLAQVGICGFTGL